MHDHEFKDRDTAGFKRNSKGNIQEAPLGILLRHAEHSHDMNVRERLDAAGVSRAFGPFLMTISHHEGVTQAEIASGMNFSAATVSVTLQKMTDAGLISKVSDNSDCRQFRIFLTEKGRAKAQEMHSIFRELEEELVSSLTEEEALELRRLLIKISERKK